MIKKTMPFLYTLFIIISITTPTKTHSTQPLISDKTLFGTCSIVVGTILCLWSLKHSVRNAHEDATIREKAALKSTLPTFIGMYLLTVGYHLQQQ
jgi:hypothetical protein